MPKHVKIRKGRLTITLPEALLEKIRERAKRYQTSPGDVVEAVLRIDFGLNIERGGAP